MISTDSPQGSPAKPITETNRLLIRHVSVDDLADLIELFGSLEVMRFSTTGPLASSQVGEVLSTILASYQRSNLSLWGVVKKPAGQLIGLCGFQLRPADGTQEWELAYRFLPQHWGRGLATEAAAACLDIAWREPQLGLISAWIEPANTASLRVAQKLGFQFAADAIVQGLPMTRFILRRPPARP